MGSFPETWIDPKAATATSPFTIPSKNFALKPLDLSFDHFTVISTVYKGWFTLAMESYAESGKRAYDQEKIQDRRVVSGYTSTTEQRRNNQNVSNFFRSLRSIENQICRSWTYKRKDKPITMLVPHTFQLL